MSLGPFDLHGPAFLALYVTLFVIAVSVDIITSRIYRPVGREQRITDPDQLAMLGGGVSRLAEAAVARLLANGALFIESKSAFGIKSRDAAHTMIEQRIVALSAPIRWATIAERVRDVSQSITRQLVTLGLWMDAEEIQRQRWIQANPYLLLIGFGMIKWTIGMMRDRPVGFLTAFLIGTAVVAAVRWFGVDRRTEAGIAAVERAKATNARLNIAPLAEETGLAVALFGTAVLVGSPYAPLHAMRTASGGDSGTSSSSGDGGGGGCGGGGCGGCGS